MNIKLALKVLKVVQPMNQCVRFNELDEVTNKAEF
jgi:hypothetical protein